MVEVVINFDQDNNVYKAYEPTTDTIFVTTSLGDTFNKLEEHLKQSGLIAGSLLSDLNITYHLDSPTFIAMVKSNASLLKRLNSAPTSFMMSSQRLGINNNKEKSWDKEKDYNGKKRRKSGTFSKSNLTKSYKKFDNK